MGNDVGKFKFEEWPKLIEHIRDLNAQGYLDHYVPGLKASFGCGWFDEAATYVHICTSPENEICLTGWPDERQSREEEANHEGSWELESVWHNDEQIPFTQYCRECGRPTE